MADTETGPSVFSVCKTNKRELKMAASKVVASKAAGNNVAAIRVAVAREAKDDNPDCQPHSWRQMFRLRQL